MLRELYIKNVAVIEDVHVQFENGLNVLSGETGAGKSIIIDSINMILGERTSREYVRHNTDRARVQAVFDTTDKVLCLLEELGIDLEDDSVILTRDITSDGKSTARINGVVVPLSSMREVASCLVNIHGQHDNQALLSSPRHIEFLDEYAKNLQHLKEYRSVYNQLKDVQNRITELLTGQKEKEEKAELMRFQVEEILSANLTVGEDESLLTQREQIVNAEKIQESGLFAYNNLYGAEMGSVYELISDSISKLESITDYAPQLLEAYNSLTDSKYAVEDAAHTIKDYADNVEFDKELLDSIEERLDLISNLKRKYGKEISDIIEFASNAQKELEVISDIEGAVENLKKQEKELTQALKKCADELSLRRQKAAKEIDKKITRALYDLNMPGAEFFVEITPTEPQSNGIDTAQFLIRTNPTEPLKPLIKIASGGELSRTMLALKTILTDGVDTLIFDEIDTGVSGMAAKRISEKLFEISQNKQVLCITHLPQLASMCDCHFLIEKSMSENRATTVVRKLDTEHRVLEIARLSGGHSTETSKAHALEMLNTCDAYKRGERK